jgi:signal transduction histidine kinase
VSRLSKLIDYNLSLLVSTSLEALKKDAQQKFLDLTVSVQDELPTKVKGNSDLFKQLLEYFTTISFKYSFIAKVDVYLIRTSGGNSTVGLKFQDVGPGLSESELDVRKFPHPQNELFSQTF